VRVVRLVVGPLATNAYLVSDGEDAAALIVDPGGDPDRIVAECRALGLSPSYIVNTHGHVDHMAANEHVRRAFPGATLCIGAGDAERLGDPAGNLSAAFGAALSAPAPDLSLTEGDLLRVARLRLEVLGTPGHTPGSICLLARDERPFVLFSGDLLFRRGVGRTDLPGGDWARLLASIRGKVLPLPDDTVVWPGHGEPTTVGEERSGNALLADI
jgi:hydroxyacylglutathione hydrolase